MNDMQKNNIQQDIQHDELKDLKEFLLSHGKYMVTGVCVILVFILAVTFYKSRTSTRIKEASRAFDTAKTVQDLESLESKYPSAQTTPLAMMRLAKIYFDTGNYELALYKYGEIKQKFPDHQAADSAELGRIHCMEAKNQLEEAAASFSEFSASHTNHFLRPQAIFGEARCLVQLGRYEHARTLYEDFIAAYPKSQWLPMAEELLDSVNQKSE
ncbi:tol-pal system YbgF family protein [Verrucomicrobiota bacterium]